MGESKSYALLFIYNALKEGKVVKKDDIIEKFKINERTFYRYIKDIKEFVEDECGSNNELLGEEVTSGIDINLSPSDLGNTSGVQ